MVLEHYPRWPYGLLYVTPTPTCQPSTHAHNSYYYIRCPSTASGSLPILDTTTRPKLGSAKWSLCCPKIPLGKENFLFFKYISACFLAKIALSSFSFLFVKCYGLLLWILWVNARNEYGWDTHSPCSSMVAPLVSFNLTIFLFNWIVLLHQVLQLRDCAVGLAT